MENSSSANEYAYQIAEIQQKQQRKHRRAESVSSDNFSSSRSDSVKAIGCGIPMRMTNRRRNSWTVTRKTSQDSNLSSSRNDSSMSAMTASTSAGTTAWRTSRSSVSSDCGSSTFRVSMRDRDRASKTIAPSTVHQNNEQQHKRAGSFRDKSMRQHPMSPLAAGILRQQSVTKIPGNHVQRTIPQGTDPTVMVTSIPGSKPKPRLTRQAAIQDEHYIPAKCVSFDSTVLIQSASENFCPLHSGKPNKLEGVWENSIEDDENDDSDQEEVHNGNHMENETAVFTQRRKALNTLYSNRDKNRLGLAGFIPRKLSTISSRSCSMNPDNTLDDENPAGIDDPSALLEGSRKLKSSYLRENSKKTFSKSDNELYCHRKALTTSNKLGSVANLPFTDTTILIPSSKQQEQQRENAFEENVWGQTSPSQMTENPRLQTNTEAEKELLLS